MCFTIKSRPKKPFSILCVHSLSLSHKRFDCHFAQSKSRLSISKSDNPIPKRNIFAVGAGVSSLQAVYFMRAPFIHCAVTWCAGWHIFPVCPRARAPRIDSHFCTGRRPINFRPNDSAVALMREKKQAGLREKVRFSINWFGHNINSDAFAPPLFFQQMRILPQKALFQFPVMVGEPHTKQIHTRHLFADERNEMKTKPLNKNLFTLGKKRDFRYM
jgi:hypothetical protein